MNLQAFRQTSRPVKSDAAYRPLTDVERAEYLRGGAAPGAEIVTGAYLRMCVTGAEDAPDGLYLIER